MGLCSNVGQNYNEYGFTYHTDGDLLTVTIIGEVCVCGNCQIPPVQSADAEFFCEGNQLTVHLNNETLSLARM